MALRVVVASTLGVPLYVGVPTEVMGPGCGSTPCSTHMSIGRLCLPLRANGKRGGSAAGHPRGWSPSLHALRLVTLEPFERLYVCTGVLVLVVQMLVFGL